MYKDAGRAIGNGQFPGDEMKSNCMVERDMPEVARAMEGLRSQVERCEHLVGRLHDRLAAVTTPAPPIGSDRGKEPVYMTALANHIHSTGSQLHELMNSLESLYARIEL